jgi:hypothetical protein
MQSYRFLKIKLIQKMKFSNSVNGAELKSQLSSGSFNFVDAESSYSIKGTAAINLLDYRRFDLVVKYVYARYKSRDIDCDFSHELYLAHISAFNGFVEVDGSEKLGSTEFLTAFDVVYDSISSTGFSVKRPIPLSRDGVILDGAHRVGVSIALGLDIPTIQLNAESPIYDYKFFRKRDLADNFLDYIAYEYAKLKANNRVVIIWPTASGREGDVEDLLRQRGNIVYYKEIFLTEIGAHNLVSLAYRQEPWVGTLSNGYVGAESKARSCFNGDGPLRVFLFESDSDLVDMKEEIRNLFGVGKHSIHINDTHEETQMLTEWLFNENSLQLLNAMVNRPLSWFNRLFSDYKSWLKKASYDKSDFCIDGSGSLAALGLRDVRDLDFLFGAKGKPPVTGFKELDCHNNEHQHKGISLEDIVYDPRNHLFFDGLKFVSLELLKKMKLNRSEEKDKYDVAMMKKVLSGQSIKLSVKQRVKRIMSYSFIKSKIKLQALKARYILMKIKQAVFGGNNA